MEHGMIQTGDLQLAYVDFGGNGPNVLALHGLYGRGALWAGPAAWLTAHFRVVALDQRGHGHSDKPDDAYSRDHYVNDAIATIEQLRLGPVYLLGHSMGALNAWVLAARRPDLVRGLVLEDMTAATAKPGDGKWAGQWLNTWPVPFPTMAAVRAFFAALRPGLADHFMEVMAEGPDGYRPLFQREHMVQSAAGIDTKDWWEELDQVQCPTLVVKGGKSEFRREDLQEMARRLRHGEYAEVAGAGHTVAFDQPEGYRAVVEPFLLKLKGQA
ncbi:MAG TPA: alpha/beta hydrolase [Symbiobacteriaceae bacterium]|jgi:pimeloyl-ACP methyl ester carboxylesterase